MHQRKSSRTLLAAAFLAGVCAFSAFTRRAAAAPPGWELRNGTWVPIIQPDPSTPDGQVAQMIKDLADNHPATVIDNAKKWLKVNKTHPLLPQVLMVQGDAELKRGRKYAALFPFEDLLNNFPTSELYTTALTREFDIADSFLNGYKKLFLGFHILPVKDEGLELMDRIQDRQRGSPLAERAGIRVADYDYDHGNFVEAVDAYSDFLKRYPYSQYARKAELRRAQASLANFHGVRLDITPLLDGRERMGAIADAYPQTAEQLQVSALNDRIYQLEGMKELEIARYYWRANRRYASAWYYHRVIDNWPGTQMAQDAQHELGKRLPERVSQE
jgi:outer membrane protein assembly factor BamD (BamD/ComL family)